MHTYTHHHLGQGSSNLPKPVFLLMIQYICFCAGVSSEASNTLWHPVALPLPGITRYFCRTRQVFEGIGPVRWANWSQSELWVRSKAKEVGLPFDANTPYKQVYDAVQILYTLAKKFRAVDVEEMEELQEHLLQAMAAQPLKQYA
jgi:hypothetical protein